MFVWIFDLLTIVLGYISQSGFEFLSEHFTKWGFDFRISVNPGYDAEEVLIECKDSLNILFQNKLYIGEPVYLSKIYNTINKVDGVSDCVSVAPKIIAGANYAATFLNLEDVISPDGTYIKTPRNVIMELKYPSLDMVGSIV